MPEIARFFAIAIAMYYEEHGVPHFHATHGDYEASVAIETGFVRGRYRPDNFALLLNGVRFAGQNCCRTGSSPDKGNRWCRFIHWSRFMDYLVVDARYVGGHRVWLRFRDGTSGEIDLKPALRGPVFEPLHDPEYFRQFTIHPEFKTLVWPNAADFAPEFLHDNIRVTA